MSTAPASLPVPEPMTFGELEQTAKRNALKFHLAISLTLLALLLLTGDAGLLVLEPEVVFPALFFASLVSVAVLLGARELRSLLSSRLKKSTLQRNSCAQSMA